MNSEFFYRKFQVYAKIYGNMLMKLTSFPQPARIILFLLKIDLWASLSSYDQAFLTVWVLFSRSSK